MLPGGMGLSRQDTVTQYTGLPHLQAAPILPPPRCTLVAALRIQTVKQYTPSPPGSNIRNKQMARLNIGWAILAKDASGRNGAVLFDRLNAKREEGVT